MFTRDRTIYRQVNDVYRSDYERLMGSGLYDEAVAAGDLVPHEEVDAAFAAPGGWRVLRPERVAFVSYPYEWCFGQLKDAALLTLRLQRTALKSGMSLKDASAYNVQFHLGRPVWIDTLSFERLREGMPWVAYRQFCEFFLGPLALMAYTHEQLHQLLRVYIDGIPVPVSSSILPARTWLQPGLALHIHLHARAGRGKSGAAATASTARPKRVMSRTSLLGLIDSLERTVKGLRWKPEGTVWADYYEATNYSEPAVEHKRDVVARAIDRLQPSTVWDLGANVGIFSQLASDRGIPTIAFDVDAAAVEKNYRSVVARKQPLLLPLLLDLTNPSGGIGWAGGERLSLVERGPAGAALALALIHHLAIGHNVPFERIASFLASIARSLVIEWVPKEDSQVQRMLATRDDVFTDYTEAHFADAFAAWFDVAETVPLRDSKRQIYVMRRRSE